MRSSPSCLFILFLLVPALLFGACDSMSGTASTDDAFPTDTLRTLDTGRFTISLDRNGFLTNGQFRRSDGATSDFLFSAGLAVAGIQDGERRASGMAASYRSQVSYDNTGAFRVRSDSEYEFGVIGWGHGEQPGPSEAQNWAWDIGAPATSDGQPIKIGDAMMSTVFASNRDNYDPARSRSEFARPLENLFVYEEIFGYSDGPVNDALYARFILHNAGDAPITNARAAFMSDPDLNRAGDSAACPDANAFNNMVGSFPDAATGYVYMPPVDGVPDRCAGAMVGFTMASDDGLLGIEQHRRFDKGTYDGWDEGSIETPDDLYNTVQGLSTEGEPQISPNTGLPTSWAWDGDPVSGEGWVYPAPRDARLMILTESFDLAPDERVEFIVIMVAVSEASFPAALDELEGRASTVRMMPEFWTR